MTTNNLNPVGTTLPATLPTPTPAPSGMSVLAKLVIGIAALFFTAFLYVAFSGSGSSRPPTMPPARGEDQLDDRQRQEVERITLALHGFFGNTPSAYAEEFGRIYAKFTGDCPITAHDIGAANLLLTNLSSPASAEPSVRVDPSRETNEQRRLLREAQDRELEETLRIDQQREAEEQSLRERESAMTKALTPLNAEISEATTALGARYKELSPLDRPWQIISNQACYGGMKAEETYATKFQQIAKHCSLEESLDRSIPDDRYRKRVDAFNAQFPDEGEAFAQKRATLAESYQAYTATLKQVHERLAWVRLRAYHDEVGEEFFAAQFSREFLSKVRNGEALLRP